MAIAEQHRTKMRPVAVADLQQGRIYAGRSRILNRDVLREGADIGPVDGAYSA